MVSARKTLVIVENKKANLFFKLTVIRGRGNLGGKDHSSPEHNFKSTYFQGFYIFGQSSIVNLTDI